MILNDTLLEGKGQAFFITPEVLLWRNVIVRGIMDALDVDIHAWGQSRKHIVEEADSWFNTKNPYFVDVCSFANMTPYFVHLLFVKIKKANTKELFKHKNLNKFLLEYFCTFENER